LESAGNPLNSTLPSTQTGFGALTYTISPPTGLLGVGLGGDNSPRMIVDGLETNDPLTNLNSGLATNLVLGMNSISEVTVNTLSYSVDQGRYGVSGTNQFP
jgi:hypothetical protein